MPISFLLYPQVKCTTIKKLNKGLDKMEELE